MSSLFISYSRKDIEVAKKLTDSFNGQGLDFWIDWQGIPPTVDWWREIEKGIEEADIFLFLISPDSAKSKVCGQEIEHAAKNGKRLIPIVVRDIEANESPTELRPLNWIFIRESDDFETGFGKLITAIKTDYEWVQTHRQLQVKALEWERSGYERSFLLRGMELEDAEFQLATNTSKEPHPTDLQREYALSSRQETDKSRRRITIGLVSFSILILGFLIFSLIQLNISRAQQLGFQSQVAFAEKDYNTAALLAYQSNQINPNDAAELTLGRIYYENFTVGETQIQDTGQSINAELSSDGRLALVLDNTKIVVRDLTTNNTTEIQTATGDENSGSIIGSLAWSPNGQLASLAFNGTITIWDVESGVSIQKMDGRGFIGFILAWSPDGRLATVSENNEIIIWDVSTGKQVLKLIGHQAPLTDIAWAKDGLLASASTDGEVIIWDIESGTPIQILQGYRIAWSIDGQLASALNTGNIIIWDVQTGAKIQELNYTEYTLAGIDDLEWSITGKLAASSYNTVLIWDPKTELPPQTLKGHTNFISSFKWSTDDGLTTYSADGFVMFWEINPSKPAQTINTDTSLSLATSVDGYLASASGKNVFIWNPGNREPIMVLEGHTDIVNSVAWSDDGRLASGSDDQTVIIWDITAGNPSQILTGHTHP